MAQLVQYGTFPLQTEQGRGRGVSTQAGIGRGTRVSAYHMMIASDMTSRVANLMPSRMHE